MSLGSTVAGSFTLALHLVANISLSVDLSTLADDNPPTPGLHLAVDTSLDVSTLSDDDPSLLPSIAAWYLFIGGGISSGLSIPALSLILWSLVSVTSLLLEDCLHLHLVHTSSLFPFQVQEWGRVLVHNFSCSCCTACPLALL